MKVYQRNGAWHIDYSFNGRRVRKKVGSSKKMAELALKEVELRIAKKEFLGYVEAKKMLFDKLCEEYLLYSKANKASSSYERDQLSIQHLLKAFGTRLLSEITTYDLECYKNQRRDEVAAGTVNRELSCAKHMLGKAVKWGHLSTSPSNGVAKFKEPPGRVRYLSDDEIERLLRYCAEHIRPIVVMALNTGMRRGEILNLKWQDVDLRNRVIKIRKTKNNETRIVPINDTLYNELMAIEPGIGNRHVFIDNDGNPLGNIKKGFYGAMRRASITDFRFHDLRHTFASRLVLAGVDIRTVQELLGHKDIRMTVRYSHLSDMHLKEAVKKLEVGTNLAPEQKLIKLGSCNS